MRRIAAITGLVIVIGCIIAALVCAITGASNNLLIALLFILIVVPCIIFGYIKIIGIMKKEKDAIKEKAEPKDSDKVKSEDIKKAEE